jgi:hypothetical protein
LGDARSHRWWLPKALP